MSPALVACALAATLLAAPAAGPRDSTIEADVFEHYFAGRELYEKGKYDEALLAWENIRAIAPEYVDAYTLIGKAELARKKPLRAAYFLVIGGKLDPKGEENRMLLERMKGEGLVAVGEVDFTWRFAGPVDLARVCVELYGNARYARAVLEANALDRIDEPGAYRIPIDFTEINALRALRKFDGRLLTDDLNQLKFRIVEEREYEISAEEDPEAYLKLVDEYLAVGRPFRAAMALEEVVYHHPERAKSLEAKLVARLLGDIDEYLRTEPRNARGHYFKAALQFIREDWTTAMASFYVAEGLGLDLKYRTRMVRFVDIARRRAREFEERRAKAEAERVVAASVKEGRAMEAAAGPAAAEPAPAEPDAPAPANEEEVVYNCTVNRSMIGQAVDRHNQDNMVEMDETNFHFRPLVSGGYLKAIPVCPLGGVYDLLPGGVVRCSYHGK